MIFTPAYGGVVTAFESRRENGKASELRSEAFSFAPRLESTRRNPKGAPQRSRRVEWLLVRVRETYIARTPEQSSGVLAISAPPTGLEPVTLRLTVECSAN